MDAKLKTLIEPEWIRIRPKTQNGKDLPWSYRLTLPFPQSWPPPRNHTQSVCYYVYATASGLFSGLMDGQYVARPWAQIEQTKSSSAPYKLKRLSDRIVKIGIQGFRPLTKSEKSLHDDWPEKRVEDYLLRPQSSWRANPKETEDFKTFFCMALSHNGVIYQSIAPNHRKFFHWLSCKPFKQKNCILKR